MITLTQIKYILVALLLGTSIYFTLSTVYNFGYQKASIVYEQKIKERNDAEYARIATIEGQLGSLLVATGSYNTLLLQDMGTIKSKLDKQPLIVYRDGKCLVSPEFNAARSEAIKRANEKTP